MKVERAMRTSKPTRIILLMAALFLAIGWQTRAILRLAKENMELTGIRQESERLRRELDETAQRARQFELDAHSLRFKRDELKRNADLLREKFLGAQEWAGELQARLNAAGLGRQESSQSTKGSPADDDLRAKLRLFPVGDCWVYRSSGRVGGVALWSAISREAVLAGESWSPGRPLPISFQEAERVSRRQLQGLVGDDRFWEVSEIQLRRLTRTKWHYGIELSIPTCSHLVPDLSVLPV